MEFKPLENSLFALRPLSVSDRDVLFEVARDKEIWRQHPDSDRYQPAGFSRYFDKLLQTDMPYLIIDKARQAIIGATSYYEYSARERQVAIGFTFLATAYWGGEANRAVKSLMIDHAFRFVDRIVFHVREKNFRSQGALAKIGAVRTKEYPAPACPGSLQLEYTIEKDRWPASDGTK